MIEKAIFAAGCFWHVEEAFANLQGVIRTRVGYTGGKTKSPNYEEVCTGETGHAEAVEITFDPSSINYKKLLEVFWKMHDPTQFNRQGPDFGNQYRSSIFYTNEKQRKEAELSKKSAQKKFDKPLVTEIKKATAFFTAEEYHQKYFQKHPLRARLCRAF